MKIRCGFVSNSSSSSFIIALSHKPNSVEEVMQMLFGESPMDEEISLYGDNVTTGDIAKRFLADIQNSCPMVDENIINEMLRRYYYSIQEGFVFHNSPFFGTDVKLLDKIANLSVKADEEDKRYYSERNEYLESKIGAPPKDQEEWKKWNRKHCDLEQSDVNLAAMFNEHCKRSKAIHEKVRSAELSLAKKDLESFKRTHKGIVLCLKYSDNRGELETIMEHGNILEYKFPCIKVDNH